jgi:tetratricopeptide (TPR) repeat protein
VRPEDDPELERLVVRALELEASGDAVDIEQLCAHRPDLITLVRDALGHSANLSGIDEAAQGFDPNEHAVFGDRYRLDRRLGAGAMGVVYLATDLELQRPVAVKVLRSVLLDGDEAAARFEREAEVLAAVQHPAVVTVFDRGSTADGLRYLVMELLDGVSLGELLQRAEERAREHGPSDDTAWLREHFAADVQLDSSFLRQSVRWIAQLSSGLEAVHEAGVFHRDIKPSNVFLRRDGSPVLLDFGIATRSSEETLSSSGSPVGTPAYMDPNQLERRGEPGPVVDVYGLCGTLYHMVTLRAPFRGTPQEILADLKTKEPPPASQVRPGLPRDLQAVLDCGMARRDSRRYPSARALRDDLLAMLEYRPVSVRPVTSFERLARRVARSREFRAAVVVLVLVAATFGVWQWRQSGLNARVDAWRADWAGIGPTQFDAPLVMRRIAVDEVRAAETARFDRMVDSGVEPITSRLVRAAWRLDNGMPKLAADDIAVVASLVDSDYARALLASYRALPADAQDASSLQIPELPRGASQTDTFLAAFHLTRTDDEDYDRAVELMREVDSDDPGVRHLQLRLTMASFRNVTRIERHEMIRVMLDRATREEERLGRPTAMTAQVAGIALQMQDYDEQALAMMRRGVALAPGDHGLHINLGNLLSAMGDYDSAVVEFAEASRLRPKSIGAGRAWVISLYRVERFDEARDVLAQMPFQQTDYDQGERVYLQAAIDLAESMARTDAGQVDEAQALARQAVAALDRCRQLGTQVRESKYFLAKAYAGEVEDRATYVAGLLSDDPSDASLLGLLLQTMPDDLDAKQTKAVRQFLEALQLALAPRLEEGK